ncbi:hypothetical protein ABPG74_022173 [Tetrahymena malaccensis]
MKINPISYQNKCKSKKNLKKSISIDAIQNENQEQDNSILKIQHKNNQIQTYDIYSDDQSLKNNERFNNLKIYQKENIVNICWLCQEEQNKTNPFVYNCKCSGSNHLHAQCLISLVNKQYEKMKKIPFVFYANQQVLPAPTSSIVDYSSKLFQAEPVIVVGFSNFHYIKSPQGISFKLQASNISKQSCQIEILDNIGIQDLNVSILAIDRTNFPNIQVIQKTSSNIFQGPSSSSLQEEEVIEFSKFIQQAKGKKQVIVILNGWNSQFPQNPISINALLINDQYYKIQIIREFPNLITSVSYTIIEYSLDSESNIYNIFSYYDSSLSSLTDSTNCLYTQCPDRHVLSQFQIPIIQNIKLPQLGYQNIFLAFNKLKYLVKPQYDYSPFIELSNYSFQINGQFSFSYFVKNRSQFLGVTLNIIFFYQKKCLKSNQKFQGDQCIDDCVNVNPIQPQFCIDCQSGQYFLQDLKICQSIEPSYSYTCYPEKNYKTCVLCNSIQNCLKCEKSLNQLQCIQCEQNYYVYKGSCQISVSSSDSISNTAKAAVGISVVSSTQGSNFMFLTLQKLNLLYMINILMTSELTIFIEQIKGTNPLSYFQYINFFNNHVYIESSEQLIEFQNTNKEFQTSLLVNGGGIVVSILITLIILLSLIVFSSYYMSGTQLGIHTKAQKILQIYQRFGSFLLYTINELILLVSSYAIFLQFAGFMNLKTSYYLAFKIITIIILTIYQSYFIVYYTNLLQQSQDQNFSSNGSQEQIGNLQMQQNQSQMHKRFLLSSLIKIFTNLSLILAQIIYTDEVPFVFYFNLQVIPPPPSSIIDYSSKLFQAEPVIVVGFSNFYYTKSPQGVSFKLQVSNVSKSSCLIESLNNIGIQELNVSILAIDRTNFPNIQVIQKSSSNIFSGPTSSSLQEEEVIEFSKFIQQAKGKKQVIVILNGWDSKSTQLTISINAIIINDQYYKIQINRRISSQITSITYTIIEYIQDSENSIYNMFSYYDSSLSSLPDTNNCLSSLCPDRHVLSQFQIPIIQNIKVPQLRYQNIFLAFNKLDYQVKPTNSFAPYIELSNYSIQVNGQFSFSYFVKNKSMFLGVTSTAIFFYQKKCLYGNQKFQGDQCIDNCVNVNPIQPQFCIDCQSGQYFLQDLKICQSVEPSYSYACYPEKNYKTCVLCSSIQNCLKCEKSLNQLQCTQCEQNYYVYKGYCQISVSSSNGISNTAKAAVAISVVYCTQGSNFMFLTLQKLNLLYMINILMTSELTIFVDQIKGTNPLSYFQYINIFDKHLFIESSEQLIDQLITNKQFQTSLLVNGGGILISIIITLIILLSLIVLSSYYMTGTQLGIHSKVQKILQIYQRFGSFLLYTINELILLVSSYGIFLQFIGFISLNTSYFLAFKIITVIILTIYQSFFVIYYIRLLQKSYEQNSSSSNNSQELEYLVNQFTFKRFLTNILSQEYIQKRKINLYFPIYMLLVENILIPCSIIIFYDNFLVQCILSLSFQFLLCLASIILRPCILLLNNIRLIIDQLCWVFIFIFMIIIGIYQAKFDQASNGEENTIQKISLFLKILMMIALCINPFIQVLHLLIITFKYIKQLYQQHNVKKRKIQECQLNKELSNSSSDIQLYEFSKPDVKQQTLNQVKKLNDFFMQQSHLFNTKIKSEINSDNDQL